MNRDPSSHGVTVAALGAAAYVAPLRVGIVVAAQFTLNSLANFVDVLRLSGDEGDRSRPIRCQWHVMSATRALLRASCGVQLAPTSTLIDVDELDYIAVIGGLLHRGRQIDEQLRSYLLKAAASGVGLLGICTGSFVLCRLGLMRQKRCCISWYHHRDFVEEFENMVPVSDELFVVDGDRITSAGGVGAALAGAYLVERHIDAASARKALRIMQIDHAKSDPALQPAPPIRLTCEDERVERALLMMERHIGEPISIDRLARALHISRRSLERLFAKQLRQSPLTAYRNLRVGRARWMLHRGKSIEIAAAATGFDTASALVRALQRRDLGWCVDAGP
jgi:transcriptional regulator GlxA family with amidase domain